MTWLDPGLEPEPPPTACLDATLLAEPPSMDPCYYEKILHGRRILMLLLTLRITQVNTVLLSKH